MTESGPGPAGDAAATALEDEPIDAVLSRLDAPPPDPRSLYYRWEREQWEAGALDLSTDRSAWRELDPATRTSVLATLSCVLIPDGRVTELLVPFVDAVASEEEQVFLTSQLVDEARAVVLADRFFEEVVQGKGPGESSDGVEPSVGLPNEHVDELLTLVRPHAESVRVDRAPSDDLYAGLLLLSVVLEGVIVVSAGRLLGRWLEQEAGLDGLRAGIVSLIRDVTRHILFAVRLLQSAREPETDLAALEATIEGALPSVRGVIEEAGGVSADFAGLPFTAAELSSEAMDCLARRIHDVGIDLPT